MAVVSVEPAEPRWGDTLTVTYDTAVEGANLLPTDDVRLVAFVYSGMEVRQTPYTVKRDGLQLTGRIPVEPSMSALSLYFVTPHGYDGNHTATVFVRNVHGAPAPGANLRQMFSAGSEGWLARFDLELSLYPDSLYAYRQKWFVGGAYDHDSVRLMIEDDLEVLEALAHKSRAEWLYVQVFGRMTLGDEIVARASILELLTDFGGTEYAARALADYRYQAVSQGIAGDRFQAIGAAVDDCVRRHPDSPLARDELIRLANATSPSIEVIEAAARTWLSRDPHNPIFDISLAIAYSRCEGEGNSERSIEYARKAINNMLVGELTYREDVSGSSTRSYLPVAYRIWSKAALDLGRPGEALGAAEAAIAVAEEMDTRSFNLLADVWHAIGEFDRAARALAQSYEAGDAIAKSKLRNLYVGRFETQDGFDDFFLALTTRSPDGDGRPTAVAFAGTDMVGNTYSLDSLSGKVIVLNFWFISCVPRRIEMPGLNELVTEYAGRDDVAFISFAMDDAAVLQKFLGTHPFEYVVIPNGHAIAQAYDVKAYPTHMIIDKQGGIAARLTGGGENRHQDLRPLIERELNRQAHASSTGKDR